MAGEGQSDKMASDMKACMDQRWVIEFPHAEKMASIDICQCLLNIWRPKSGGEYSEVVHFSSGDSDSGHLC